MTTVTLPVVGRTSVWARARVALATVHVSLPQRPSCPHCPARPDGEAALAQHLRSVERYPVPSQRTAGVDDAVDTARIVYGR